MSEDFEALVGLLTNHGVASHEDPNVGLEPGCLASRLASCLVGVTTADVDLEGRVRTVSKC